MVVSQVSGAVRRLGQLHLPTKPTYCGATCSERKREGSGEDHPPWLGAAVAGLRWP